MSAPKVEVQKDPNYRTIIVSGLYGGHRPGYFEAIVYTDEMAAEEALSIVSGLPEKVFIRRTLLCRLFIDPVQAKSIAKWLNQHIADYEKAFGPIPTPPEEKPSEAKPLYG